MLDRDREPFWRAEVEVAQGRSKHGRRTTYDAGESGGHLRWSCLVRQGQRSGAVWKQSEGMRGREQYEQKAGRGIDSSSLRIRRDHAGVVGSGVLAVAGVIGTSGSSGLRFGLRARRCGGGVDASYISAFVGCVSRIEHAVVCWIVLLGVVAQEEETAMQDIDRDLERQPERFGPQGAQRGSAGGRHRGCASGRSRDLAVFLQRRTMRRSATAVAVRRTSALVRRCTAMSMGYEVA
jgi:hypothetical protein